MAYRWRHDGPAFEFPTPFGTENRFLTARGVLLAVCALAAVVLAGLGGSTDAERPVVVLEKLPEPGSPLPLVLAGLLLLVFGALNLWQALRQRVLLLQPGQPASLVGELSREASGAGAGAATLMQGLARGLVAPAPLAGPYLGLLQRMGRDLPASPAALHEYLRQRLAQLALALGLGLAAAGLMAWPGVAGAATGALVLMAAGGLLALLQVADPGRPAPTPARLALLLGGVVLAALLVAALAGRAPALDKLGRFNLPLAALLMFGCSLLFDLLGLAAALDRVERPQAARAAHEDVGVAFDAHPAQLLREIDRELGRRWTDGVPNRRYVWQWPKVDAAAEEGGFSAMVLEESQPVALPRPADGRAEGQPQRVHWLLVLDVLGLLLSVAGALLWLRSAWAHLDNVALPWTQATLGFVLVLAGGWALRVAHGLWGRIEVESTLTWLELKGAFYRLSAAAAAPAAAEGPGWSRAEPAVGVEDLTLRSFVVQARSVFYAEGARAVGNRVLLTLLANPAAAAIWTRLAQDFAHKLSANPAAATPAAVAARAKAHQRRVAEREQAPAAARRTARFCSKCGTPVLAGARFCQQCGQTLAD